MHMCMQQAETRTHPHTYAHAPGAQPCSPRGKWPICHGRKHLTLRSRRHDQQRRRGAAVPCQARPVSGGWLRGLGSCMLLDGGQEGRGRMNNVCQGWAGGRTASPPALSVPQSTVSFTAPPPSPFLAALAVSFLCAHPDLTPSPLPCCDQVGGCRVPEPEHPGIRGPLSRRSHDLINASCPKSGDRAQVEHECRALRPLAAIPCRPLKKASAAAT